MKSVATISVSLEQKYIDALDVVAKTAGSRSAAVRHLLAQHEKHAALQDMEAAYKSYFEAPEAAQRERSLSEELLPAMSWPTPQGERDARKKRTPR